MISLWWEFLIKSSNIWTLEKPLKNPHPYPPYPYPQTHMGFETHSIHYNMHEGIAAGY